MSEFWEITEPGLSVVTDMGRRGLGQGLSAHGALDQQSARLANALVGNDLGAPVLEATAFDVAFAVSHDCLLAVTGAAGSLTVGGSAARLRTPVLARQGQAVAVRGIRRGLRSYVAVYGSFSVPGYVGSCAPDPVIGFGRRCRAGDRLRLSAPTPPLAHPEFQHALIRVAAPDLLSRRSVVPVTDGPDVAEFGETIQRLYDHPFEVGDRSDAVGIRLSGRAPTRTSRREPRSTGVAIGAIEVTSGNQIIALHRGRGITAGYAIAAVVTRIGLDRLAQARPGDRVTFRRVTELDAVLAHRRQVLSAERIRARARHVLAYQGRWARRRERR